MRRWLVAVFALHFFLSVGAFPSGNLPTPEPVPGAVLDWLAEPAAPAGPVPTEATSVHAADSSPQDGQAELPECLDAPLMASGRDDPPHALQPPGARDLTPPVLDEPQRPPRGPRAAA